MSGNIEKSLLYCNFFLYYLILKCQNSGELSPFFYDLEETCHEHYTKGPCSTPGHLFLPGGRCDCHRFLPHYHHDQQMCYELSTN